ncbi:MAG: ATP-grasp domain-containing protein [Methylomicrobium sp.]
MKILVFEYISGGGRNRNELPDSLAREGLLMLNSLLEGLAKIPEVDITVMLDARLMHELDSSPNQIALIGPQDDCFSRFERLAKQHDAVWPIAPEFDSILFTLCRTVEQLGKTLLVSGSDAVRLAGDKYRTFQCLIREQIPTVSTRMLNNSSVFSEECVIKPVDGVGGEDSYRICDADDFERIVESLHGTGKYIVQPHLYGEKTSLSCLFKNGRSWLLSVNLQEFDIVNGQYRLAAIQVNCRTDLSPYRNLAASIAKAIPGLWGYAGIDLIETPERVLVLEVNPRLTSSFVGLNAALGINAAALVLQLLHGDPIIQYRANKSATVQVKWKI